MSEKSREIGVLGAGVATLMAGLLAAKPANAQHAPAYESIANRTLVSCLANTRCEQAEGNMHEANVWAAPGQQVCVNMQGPRRQDGSAFKLYTWRGYEVTGATRCGTGPQSADDHCDVTATPLPVTSNPARGSRAPEATQAFQVCAGVPGGADVPGRPERVVSLVGKRVVDEGEGSSPFTIDDPGQELRMNIHHGQGAGSNPEQSEPEPEEGGGSDADFAFRAGPMGFSNSAVDDAGTGSSFAGEVCLGANNQVAGCANVTVDHNPLVEPKRDESGRPVADPVTGLFGKLIARVRHPLDGTRRTAMELRLGGGVGTNLAGRGGEALFNGEASVGVIHRFSEAVRAGIELVGGLTRRNQAGPDQTITSGGVRGVINF